ncbi:maleylpyruvate isomerase family mycothiol-dependent enzyme [Streptomyces sp. SID13726]|uniref:maleylpyruvate isomerase family mycothiol-dependent enzyme n=1 Tax=Streptomyces sp. SID13726 TaxID=2706058 RepID=UPI0013B80340|nr:maleylpyruvate isomerase family mycothiol-dependent enzyme [Streptomyces sp. SID13726]NEB03689.1 maleylpyruvate isomerase family mycothiol-dependent enzyme [Streptomyces sp. SID13726]
MGEALSTFDDYCEAIVAQTDLLARHIKGADPTAAVPTCPGWDLGRLLRHVGADHRWAEEIVRTRATGPTADTSVDDPAAHSDVDDSALGGWLAEGAARLSGTLRAAGPDVPVWTPADEQLVEQTTRFWARRMTYETLLHRADAALVTGAEFTVEASLAVDAVEEWLEFSTVTEAYEPLPGTPDLLGPGHTLRFDAGPAGEWLLDLTGRRPIWRRGSGEAAVSVRGPVTDLLLFLYARPAPGVVTRGDAALLDLWLGRTRFWLEL